MKTGTFQKRQVRVEALQITDPIDWNQVTEFFGEKSGGGHWQAVGESVSITDSHRGVTIATPNHWIMRDDKDEYHVLSNENFAKLYEEVEDE